VKAPWTTPPARVEGEWIAYRHTDRRFPPLWYGGGAATTRQESARWHEEGAGVAQYLALSINGAWAERCRYAHIRDDKRRLEDRRSLWQLQVLEHDIADLSSFEAYAACGLTPSLAVGKHTDCRPLAEALRAAGYRGVLSPSAAYDAPGAVNLTLFGERIEAITYGAMPPAADNPRPELFLATVLITDSGSPTEYAMRHTCYQSDHHRQFAAYARGMRPEEVR
jgi:hypothetical protein